MLLTLTLMCPRILDRRRLDFPASEMESAANLLRLTAFSAAEA